MLKPIYLLFKNNIVAFSNPKFISVYFNAMMLFIFSSTVPCFILESISEISDNSTINLISYHIYYNLYYLPSFMILFIIHNFKLFKLLSSTFKLYSNPNHIYISCLSLFLYIVFFLIGLVNDSYLISYYVSNVLSFSVFFNELAYSFVDNDKYGFRNKIDFYNANSVIFIFYAILISYILHGLPKKLFLPISFTVSAILQNSLIGIEYSKPKKDKSYNILYFFELIFNPLVKYIGNFVMFWMRDRDMINIKY